MSKNVKVNGVDYAGISLVQLKTSEGGTAVFQDVDEITTPSGAVENAYEMGQFAIETVTTNYTYNHSLGRVPKFAIVYPISVAKTEGTTYAISVQTIINGLGQDDYNISTTASVKPNNPFSSFYGVGYNTSAEGNAQHTEGDNPTLIECTADHITVGQQTSNASGSGKFLPGTYGIIVG